MNYIFIDTQITFAHRARAVVVLARVAGTGSAADSPQVARSARNTRRRRSRAGSAAVGTGWEQSETGYLTTYACMRLTNRRLIIPRYMDKRRL